jgi:hypothetical protein
MLTLGEKTDRPKAGSLGSETPCLELGSARVFHILREIVVN